MTPPVSEAWRGDVVTLTLDRPERRNALGPDMAEALLDAVQRAPADGARLLVFQGAGDHFCAGFDLSDLEVLSDGDLLARFVRIELLLQAVRYAPIPTVAVVQGAAIGAGADLVVSCEHRMVVDKATFAFPGAGFGIALGTGRLADRVGETVARDLVGSGRRFGAEEALRVGMINQITTAAGIGDGLAELENRARRLEASTQAAVNALTVSDRRDRDLAALVASAARPGLKSRVQRYLESLSTVAKTTPR